MTNERNETIAAVATGTGGAVALIRISGERAVPIGDALFRSIQGKPLSTQKGYTIHYGTIRDGEAVIDEVLISLFRAPHSYTGEDMIEISCHASDYILRRVMESGNPARRSDRATGRVHATGISGRQNGPVASRSRRRRHRIRQPRRTRFGVQTNARRLLGRVRPTQGKTRTPRISTRAGTGLRRRRRGVCRSGTIARNIDGRRTENNPIDILFRTGQLCQKRYSQVAIAGAPNVGKSPPCRTPC